MNKLTEKEIQLINQIKRISGFEDIEATDEGYAKFDAKLNEMEKSFDNVAVNLEMLDKVTMTTKIHDLNREVTVTFKTQDEDTFKLLVQLAPFVELLPILAKLDMLPLNHFDF